MEHRYKKLCSATLSVFLLGKEIPQHYLNFTAKRIYHFQVIWGLCFKTSPRPKPFTSTKFEHVFILMVSHEDSSYHTERLSTIRM